MTLASLLHSCFVFLHSSILLLPVDMLYYKRWRGRLVAYGAALERRFAGNRIEGSNPSPSAMRIRLSRKIESYFHSRRSGFERDCQWQSAARSLATMGARSSQRLEVKSLSLRQKV